MTETGEKLALIINSASYERVAFALNVAMAAAAVGKDVNILFGHGGVIRLKRGFTDAVGDETVSWIREQIKWGIEKGGVDPLSESIDTFKKLGGKIYACPAAMELHNIVVGDLVEDVDEVRSVVRFVTEDTEGASIIYV
ncbi:MAG: DsrE family protein [Chloroflexi bacterium]|nr:DsrE family protein [Chloroflexota bacterium]